MEFSEFFDYLRTEWAVIAAAPLLSIGLIALGMAVGFAVMRWFYENRIAQKDATIETLRATIEHGKRDNPALAHGFNAALERTAKQIADWRMMVGYAKHRCKQPDETRNAVDILEADPRYLSVRRWLSPETQEALLGKRVPPEGKDQTAYALRCVADDIDAFEKSGRVL